MADQRGSSLAGERLLSLVAVEALAIATALAFGRVFVGGGATAKLVVAAAASTLVAALLERRSLVVATLASAACLLVALTWLAFPHTTRDLLPTSATVDAVRTALREVGRQAQEQVSPTPALPPLLLAAVTAVWAAAFSIHALAVRAASPLLCLVPSAALIGFADSALKGHGTVTFAAMFLAGALAVLFADAVRRVRRWGTVRPWRGPSGRPRSLLPRGAGGVALLTVFAALVLPGLLPGFGSAALLDLRSQGPSGGTINPLVSIGAKLAQHDPQPLFTVRSSERAYWRMLALDQFDGTTWTAGNLDAAGLPTIPQGTATDPRAPEGGTPLEQHVTVRTDLGGPWIPAAYAPVKIAFDQPGYRYDPSLGMAVAPDPLHEGETYDVTSRLTVPTPRQLEAERFGPPRPGDPETTLPDTIPPEIGRIARQWSAGATTPYEKILAIQDHLLGFHYDPTVAPVASDDALVTFLTRTQSGFCQQFAAAMAVLVRSLGYPARVAVGFTPGTPDGAGQYLVTTHNAHSWVEVDFPRYGWIAFEPTPGVTNPIAQSYLEPAAAECDARAAGCPQKPGALERGTGSRDATNRFLRLARRRAPGHPARAPASTRAARRPEPGFPTGRILAALLLAGLLALLLLPPVKYVRRRLRLARSARDPRALVLATYDVFAARAADVGLGRSASETMVEYEGRLRERVRSTDAEVGRLTAAATRAAYAPDRVGRRDADEADRAARLALRAIRRDRGRLRQVVGLYRGGL